MGYPYSCATVGSESMYIANFQRSSYKLFIAFTFRKRHPNHVTLDGNIPRGNAEANRLAL